MSEEKLERIVTFEPAFDHRDPDPSKNYGIGCVSLRMVLKGKLGAVQFVLFTGWHLPHIKKTLPADRMMPMPADIGYHSPKPRYEGQSPVRNSCKYVDGGVCYYDGSSCQAEEAFALLVREGDEALWALLERRYHDWFDEEVLK